MTKAKEAPKTLRLVEPGIKKLTDGRYRTDLRPDGAHGRRHEKTFTTLGEARRYKSRVLNRASEGKDWSPAAKDMRPISALADEWFRLHGHSLKDGAGGLSKLHNIALLLNDPPAWKFNEDMYLSFRMDRLASGRTVSTCNHDLSYLKLMFSKLKKSKKITVNPLELTTKLPESESEIRFLELEEIVRLLSELDNSRSPDGKVITKICLATGARWGEAENLRREQITTGKIEFAATKNRKARAIPISAELEKEITGDRKKYGRIFAGAYEGFTNALSRSEIKLPRGQRTHVLRHSFAVHFMRQRGNILDLQKILGHKTLQMTLRYAQFHPDYLADAIVKNPLVLIESL